MIAMIMVDMKDLLMFIYGASVQSFFLMVGFADEVEHPHKKKDS